MGTVDLAARMIVKEPARGRNRLVLKAWTNECADLSAQVDVWLKLFDDENLIK